MAGLESLHWHPVADQVDFKLACLAFECAHSLAPSYLCEKLLPCVPPRCLQSESEQLLVVPRFKTRS